MPIDIKILPCPFCGGEAHATGDDQNSMVRCEDCAAKIERTHAVKYAIEDWNNRRGPGGQMGMVEHPAVTQALIALRHASGQLITDGHGRVEHTELFEFYERAAEGLEAAISPQEPPVATSGMGGEEKE